MREVFKYLFRKSLKPEITLFSGWHFMYIALIIGLTLGLVFLIRNKSEKTKILVTKIICYALVIVYIADFFIMPLYGVEMGGYLDKLPFHFCTSVGILAAFVQFNKSFKWAKQPVAALAIVSTLMYITYPGSALGGIGAFSYKVVQTFVYHGLLFAWGVLFVTTKQTELKWKDIWKPLLLIVSICLWAAFGNAVYADYDWCFITGSTFPFIPTWLMPIVVVAAVFAMISIIYLINFITIKIIKKKSKDIVIKQKK